MNKALVHSTESFGSVDGPGIRFIIFLQGCRLRCQYCHNPDTWNIHADGANWLSVSEILDRAERFRSYWRTAGGITVSGGEPLLQIDFLLELFAEAKRRNITTCIDTSAEPFTRDEPFYSKFQALMRLTDTVLLDIKHIDDLEHRRLTGKTNRNISTALWPSTSLASTSGYATCSCLASPTRTNICALRKSLFRA